MLEPFFVVVVLAVVGKSLKVVVVKGVVAAGLPNLVGTNSWQHNNPFVWNFLSKEQKAEVGPKMFLFWVFYSTVLLRISKNDLFEVIQLS
jgi:hypothetical protein